MTPRFSQHVCIFGFAAWVAGKIFVWGKLGWIDKHTGQNGVCMGQGMAHQRDVASMKRPHRWDEGHAFALGTPLFAEGTHCGGGANSLKEGNGQSVKSAEAQVYWPETFQATALKRPLRPRASLCTTASQRLG
jgi:hypothetical protein